MKNFKDVPSFDELIEPCFEALKELGGSGTSNEIYNLVIKNMKIKESVLLIMQNEGGSRTKVDYNLAWARTYLKKYGAIVNSSHSVWEIVNEFKNKKITREEVIAYKSTWANKKGSAQNTVQDEFKSIVDMPEENKPWNNEIMEVLYQMNPYSFERLAQNVLRNMGIDNVSVTKKSNDGGVDGYGVFKLNGIISFNIAFQCKRYKGAVGSPEIRDFRGSISTDIEKALMITTGTFTQDAKKEACAQGKIKIDLIDGDDFVTKLIELGIGVKETKTYIVDKDYFLNY